ncbi:uncharacterized protein F4822DRAFT_34603 [Hypoxylon trugodes]|uniref:uncharacterized protein n=1 Tax=Hypoxylon trugodes TaxID=326681 RepID=UPI0021966D07|nr:uncharacterized protein F4822DRAFT_34603 [Hypoxylon trugodes]KAI1394041.1 hypothetical protein F4822DRAFT_34603 [Hypoxylon trugodes]
MDFYISFAFIFTCLALAVPFSESEKDIVHRKVGITKDGLVEMPPYANLTFLEKRDEIDDWNHDNPDNTIAGWYVCPDSRVLVTLFNARAVYQAFQRGVWYMRHPNEDQPRWSGREYPHTLNLDDYWAHRVDVGRADGELYMFPLAPNPLGEWPGIPGAPVSGPPGNHRVVFSEHGIFAGVATLYYGEPEGTRLVWCYPVTRYGSRDLGATHEGNPGVDEAWRDTYDGFHYLSAYDPSGGSHPPNPS